MERDSALVCPACGYYLKSITSSVCPECGRRFMLARHPESGWMRPADLFTVGVRLLGLWFLVQFAEDLRTLLDITMGWFTPTKTPIAVYYLGAFMHLLIGYGLLFRADVVASIACKSRDDTESPSDATPDDKA